MLNEKTAALMHSAAAAGQRVFHPGGVPFSDAIASATERMPTRVGGIATISGKDRGTYVGVVKKLGIDMYTVWAIIMT